MRLPADSRIGVVTLDVADLDAMSTFYQRGVGLERLEESDAGIVLGSGDAPLLVLAHRPDLAAAPKGSAGLYHTAVLFEERTALAAALYATATAGVGSFTGSADHLVSLAFYFDDPEGNGVELYWDRPREEWRWTDGQVAMDSLPLDPNRFIAEHRGDSAELNVPVGAAATIGHVHLKVGDIPAARAFYVDTLGLDVTFGGWPSALFTSAGGYHHHVGMNTWESRGAGRRSDALGLGRFSIVVPTAQGVADTAARLEAAGAAVEREGANGLVTTDPWGTAIEVVAGS